MEGTYGSALSESANSTPELLQRCKQNRQSNNGYNLSYVCEVSAKGRRHKSKLCFIALHGGERKCLTQALGHAAALLNHIPVLVESIYILTFLREPGSLDQEGLSVHRTTPEIGYPPPHRWIPSCLHKSADLYTALFTYDSEC